MKKRIQFMYENGDTKILEVMMESKTLGAVSYTHLDVYKRQITKRRNAYRRYGVLYSNRGYFMLFRK